MISGNSSLDFTRKQTNKLIKTFIKLSKPLEMLRRNEFYDTTLVAPLLLLDTVTTSVGQLINDNGESEITS